jgi:hypothetical protein
MIDNSAPNICPRCTGQLYEELDREFHCLQCGHVVYLPDPSPSPYLREPTGSDGNWTSTPPTVLGAFQRRPSVGR